MNSTDDYKGDKNVFLPADYMKSIDAAVELHDDDLASGGASNLQVEGFERSRAIRAIECGLAVSYLWLLPAIWIVCV